MIDVKEVDLKIYREYKKFTDFFFSFYTSRKKNYKVLTQMRLKMCIKSKRKGVVSLFDAACCFVDFLFGLFGTIEFKIFIKSTKGDFYFYVILVYSV